MGNAIKITLSLLLPALALNSQASCTKVDTSSPQSTIGNTIFYFENHTIPESNETGGEPVYQLDLMAKNCVSNDTRKIDSMPYLSDTGKIVSIFPATLKEQKLFVIHRAEIISDTGTPYSSDYYTIRVYTPNKDNTFLDKQLTKYFGYGADILDSTKMRKIYSFPYKTQKSIEEELISEEFKKASHHETWKAIVTEKTYFHREPIITEQKNSYIIPGDYVYVSEKQANWCNSMYMDKKNKSTTGWILCSHIKISK